SFDGAASLYTDGKNTVYDGKHPYASWTRVHAHNIQVNRMARLAQVKEISGGYKTSVNEDDLYDRFLTTAAIRRLGR
ncbi:MAG: hypothetical protein KUG81_01210, partial [Gammaproteobacteria bacterium]|nr:hypothetical protein [Gammaproteobacteria bacterium]